MGLTPCQPPCRYTGIEDADGDGQVEGAFAQIDGRGGILSGGLEMIDQDSSGSQLEGGPAGKIADDEDG